jgi:hypothetical protein
MKWVFLLLLTPLLLQAAEQESPWSQPVKGLRARLYVLPSHEPEFDKTYDVYLEFENVGVVGNLGVIREEKTFQYCKTGLALDVTDANNQKLPRMEPAGSGDELEPCWNLCLPPGGKLSFPIGSGGATPPHDLIAMGRPTSPAMGEGKYLTITPFLAWVLPITGSNSYYLSGTFSFNIPKVPAEMRAQLKSSGVNWEGKLVLPPLKVLAR